MNWREHLDAKAAGLDPLAPAYREQREQFLSGSVLDSLKLLTASFSALLLLFAVLDTWMLPPRHRFPVQVVALLIAVMLAVISYWLHTKPLPLPLRFVNPLAFGIGMIGLARVLSYAIASPEQFLIYNLVVIIVGAGCVLLSPAWLTTYLVVSIGAWSAIAFRKLPPEHLRSSVIILIAMTAVAYVVLFARRQSYLQTWHAQTLHNHARKTLDTRSVQTQVINCISRWLLNSNTQEVDRAVEKSLEMLGQHLRADHAFVCRLDRDPWRTTVVHEWVAKGHYPRKPYIQQAPLAGQENFVKSLLAGQAMHLPDVDATAASWAPAELSSLKQLGARAFLSMPLMDKEGLPCGYVGIVNNTEPRDWTAMQVELLGVVGDVITTSLARQEATAALKNSERRFRRIFEANIIGMFFANTEGVIFDANESFLEMTGYGRADLPMSWNQLTPSRLVGERQGSGRPNSGHRT